MKYFLVLLLTVAATAQTWPELDDLAVADEANTPIAIAPGHTDEEPLCEGNENLEGQVDVTDTFVSVDIAGFMRLRSYYNINSAASTTRQFWFFNTDNDTGTGGPTSVPPDYIDNGPVSGQGPQACDTPGCSTTVLGPEETGFEYYIMSYGHRTDQFALFEWDGLAWVEQPQPAGDNQQGADDDPANPYPGDNGYRAIEGFPVAALGVTALDTYRGFTCSWNCILCCGDHSGGEFIVVPPEAHRCRTTLCGDCDLDNRVTIVDALVAAKFAVALADLDDAGFSNCNVIGVQGPVYEAQVSILDSLEIAKYIIGRTLLSCCVP